MRRATVFAAVLVLVMAAATPVVAAEEAEMDPLLELLVEQGVITLEQAKAVQVEYDSRKAVAEAPAPAAPEVAEAAFPAEEKTTATSQWTDRMKVLGDVRLRYEGFNQDGGFNNDHRDRFRIRLRAGLKAEITDWMTFGMELRNGDPSDPVSNNTSFDGGFQFKEFNLAQGYVDVRPTDWLGLIGGKFDAKKRWTVSDFQWDDDVTVEGFMQNFQLAEGKGPFRALELATYQYLLEESKTDRDSYTFGGQLRSDFKIGSKHSLGLGAGFDYWRNPQEVVDLTLSGTLGGNKVTNFLDENDVLISDFEILNLFVEYRFAASARWPLKFNLFYYKNLGANGIGKDQDTGYFGRVQIGDYKSVGQIAVRYNYYYSEPDAVFYVFTQSDTSRASDLKAHRFDLRIGFYAKSYFNLTWYNSRPAFREDEPLNRWQMDYIIKF